MHSESANIFYQVSYQSLVSSNGYIFSNCAKSDRQFLPFPHFRFQATSVETEEYSELSSYFLHKYSLTPVRTDWLCERIFLILHHFLYCILSSALKIMAPLFTFLIPFDIQQNTFIMSHVVMVFSLHRITLQSKWCLEGCKVCYYVFTFLKTFKYEFVNYKQSKNKHVSSFN